MARRKPIMPGDRFGRLVTLKEAAPLVRPTYRRPQWLTQCDCGKQVVVTILSLKTGNTHSCGCARTKYQKRAKGRPEYSAWRNLIARCTNPDHTAYKNYGGRGITVCTRWLEDFEAFLADVGPRPSPKHSIDRRDNNGNYEPGNCRWVTRNVQSQNQRRRGKRLSAFGLALTIAQWAETRGVRAENIRARLRSGWTAEHAIHHPAGRWQQCIYCPCVPTAPPRC